PLPTWLSSSDFPDERVKFPVFFPVSREFQAGEGFATDWSNRAGITFRRAIELWRRPFWAGSSRIPSGRRLRLERSIDQKASAPDFVPIGLADGCSTGVPSADSRHSRARRHT